MIIITCGIAESVNIILERICKCHKNMYDIAESCVRPNNLMSEYFFRQHYV